MTDEEKARRLAFCRRQCRGEMRKWALAWRKARLSFHRQVCVAKAIEAREAADYYAP